MRDGREYRKAGKAQYARRRAEEGGNLKKVIFRFLIIVSILTVMNTLLMLQIQARVRNLEKELIRVKNILNLNQQEKEGGDITQSGQEKTPAGNLGNAPASPGKSQKEETDYVELCGLEQVDKPMDRTTEQVWQRLDQLAEENERIAEILQKSSQYPNRLLYALANNPEMADFAVNYPTAKAQATGEGLTDKEKEQEYPLFLQWDPRWGYAEYGDDIIGLSGCGPACLSMMLYYLTGDESLTPDKIADYAMENGYYQAGVGTAWALLEDIPVLYGVKVSQPGISEQTLHAALDQGNIIICSVKPGDFTSGGHFIVVYGYDSEGFLVNDPNCVARSRKKWPYERLGNQIKNLWIYQYGSAGNGFAGNNATGSNTTGNSTGGNGFAGNNTTGSNTTGNSTGGNSSAGNGAAGNNMDTDGLYDGM